MTQFGILEEKAACYDLPGFKPVTVSKDFLSALGVDYPILDKVDVELLGGSEWFKGLFENRALTPKAEYCEATTDETAELEIHNYTGICPTNVLEVTPSAGSCAVACQYCLVTDGKHIKGIELFTNYRRRLSNSLARNKDQELFYYFSPKTEAFSEPHLHNGMAHEILRAFIEHYQTYPDSKVRMFIATKAGVRHLEIEDKGDSIFDLMGKIASKIQVNGSIGIMPQYLRDVLEPNAAGIQDRLAVLEKCRELGLWAESVLCQPLFLPYLTPENVDSYLQALSRAGVKNIKPEFFTAEVKNLVLIGQYINHFDPDKVGEFFYPYLRQSNLNHIKQRARIAPDKAVCVEKLSMLQERAARCGITISICNWVKRELGLHAEWVKTIDTASTQNGYRCLGYQTHLFRN